MHVSCPSIHQYIEVISSEVYIQIKGELKDVYFYI